MSGKRHGFALFYRQTEILQHERLVVGIAERNVFHRQIKVGRCIGRQQIPRFFVFRFFQHDIRQPLGVQPQHFDLHKLVDERAGLAFKLRFVCHKRRERAHSKRPV